jgi:hypothetical protein
MPAAVRCQVNMSAQGLAHLRRWPGWTSHDLHTAMSYIADHIVCDTPAGRLQGAEAYRDFQGPFVEILTARWRKIFTGNMIRGGSCGD